MRLGDMIEAAGRECPPWARSVMPAASGWRVALLGVRIVLGVVGTYTVSCSSCGALAGTSFAGAAAACADEHEAACAGVTSVTV